MPQNKQEDLRNHLFMVLEDLNGAEDDETLDRAVKRAKAVAGVAREINTSAKNEISYLNLLAKHGKMPDQAQHQHLLGKGKTSDDE